MFEKITATCLSPCNFSSNMLVYKESPRVNISFFVFLVKKKFNICYRWDIKKQKRVFVLILNFSPMRSKLDWEYNTDQQQRINHRHFKPHSLTGFSPFLPLPDLKRGLSCTAIVFLFWTVPVLCRFRLEAVFGTSSRTASLKLFLRERMSLATWDGSKEARKLHNMLLKSQERTMLSSKLSKYIRVVFLNILLELRFRWRRLVVVEVGDRFSLELEILS